MAPDVLDQVRHEVGAMVSYALSSGLEVPPSVVVAAAEIGRGGSLDPDQVTLAVRVHRKLSAIVTPAVPRTIILLEQEKRGSGRFSWLPSMGPIRVVRQLTGLSIVFLVAFVALSLSNEVNDSSGDIFDSEGLALLLNLLFLLAAAGLGATFSGLFRAMRYVGEGTFDPKYEATYWVRVVLGLVAGLLLSQLLMSVLMGAEGPAPQGGSASDGRFTLGRPILALLGGFSADLVFRMLQRLVEAVESIFKGDTAALVQIEVQQAQAKAAQQLADSRLNLSAKLIRLDQQVQSGADSAETAKAVREMLDELLPMEGLEPPQ